MLKLHSYIKALELFSNSIITLTPSLFFFLNSKTVKMF